MVVGLPILIRLFALYMTVFENWQTLIPEEFHDDSRVWIYQSNRLFSIGEALQIEPMLKQYVAQWQSHGDAVKGFANLFFGQFIVLMADETQAGVSGCSTDSSVRLIKSIEQQFNVSLFDRQLLAFLRNDKVEVIPMNQCKYALEQGILKPETIYFNNTVLNKKSMLEQWMIPIKNSWLSQKYKIA